jgi:hypothetical protein
MLEFPTVLLNGYVSRFEIDPQSILELDLMRVVPESIFRKWCATEMILEDILYEMPYEERSLYKMRWVWNHMNSYQRSVVFDRLFNR